MILKNLIKTYPIEKPGFSIQLILLTAITICGLAALFFAAFASFRLSTGNTAQAFFAAILIEVGLAVEAMSLIKRPKTPYPWIGLFIAFFVSGTYNWYQAEAHMLQSSADISNVTLSALAFGPLSALAFVSLTLGNEMREYQNKISKWQENAMAWAENERKRIERKEARAERLRKIPVNGNNGSVNLPVNLPVNCLPDWLPVDPTSITNFRNLVNDGTIILPPGLTGKKMTAISAVKDERTGRNWLRAVNYKRN